MAKQIPDIIHEPDLVRGSSHKPRGSIYGPQAAYWGRPAQSQSTEAKKNFYVHQFVLAKDGNKGYKAGHIIGVGIDGEDREYSVKLSEAHGSIVISTREVVASPHEIQGQN